MEDLLRPGATETLGDRMTDELTNTPDQRPQVDREVREMIGVLRASGKDDHEIVMTLVDTLAAGNPAEKRDLLLSVMQKTQDTNVGMGHPEGHNLIAD